ncbi:dermonecrotic toxin domain-containing protein [Pseudomonas sp. KCJK9016]|uniref:dermonecrotic toxin domain-containing protein n=1 Tax=Pseudomonas sp. KCJK9016 TaxID=3344556 RepID=UPI00390623A1
MSAMEKNSIEAGLGKVDQGFVEFERMLGTLPSFKSLLQDLVLKELQTLLPDIYISKTYITARGPEIVNPQPTGLLMDVFMQCLALGRAPVYDASQYGVYDWPDSTDDEDRIQGLDVAAVGSVIGSVLGSLVHLYPPLLTQYWAASSGKDDKGRALPSRSRQLQDAYAALFWHELSATVQLQGVRPEVEESFAVYIRGASMTPAYSVSLQLENGRFATLAGCFVTYLAGRSVSEMIAGDDEWVVLFTHVNGLETFRTSAMMQRVLEQRLENAESRAQLLKGISLEDAAQVRSVPDIRYLNIQGELFRTVTAQLLDRQQSDVAWHLRQLEKSGSDLHAIIRSIESTHRQEDVIGAARGRIARLLVLMNKKKRPQWLKDAPATHQEVFASMEKELLRSQVALHESMGGVSSFQEYVRGVVETHISAGDTQRVDPDAIWVTVQYSLPMGSRYIEHIERKTLTQLFMYGVHDKRAPYSIRFEAFHNNPRLTASSIEHAIRQFDLRVQYASERNDRFGREPVREAMREVLAQQIAVSHFAAILQQHITAQAQNIVQRYLLGDPAMEASGVAFRRYYRPFKDMIAFRAKGPTPDRSMHVLYAPGAPAGQQWFEFTDLTALKRQFIAWGFETRERDFLIRQAFSEDRADFEKNYLSYSDPGPVFQPWWWEGVTLVQWTQGLDGGPLMGAIHRLIEWEVAEERVATPVWFRNAAAQDRERLTRLNTEFRAIYEVSKDELNIPTMMSFSRDLVMERLNSHLRRSDPKHPLIDPDQVNVKVRGQEWMTLTQLFIQWQLWPSDDKVAFIARNGSSLGSLNASDVKSLINLRPAMAYEWYLVDRFANSPSQDLKAKLFCKVKQNEMLRGALIQKMQGSLSSEQFDWLTGLIEGLDHDRPHELEPFKPGTTPQEGVYTLALEGRRIEGAYTFGRRVAGKLQLLVYIPKAPDGLSFRPLESLTLGLKDGSLGDHVVALTRLEHRAVVQNFVTRCQNAVNALPAPALNNSYAVTHFKFEFDSMISRVLSDVDHQTTTPAERFWNTVLVVTELALDIVSLFVPPVGLVTSIVRITRSIVQGIVAYSLGDDEAGKHHLASAWRSSILLYVGVIAGVGGSVSAVGALSRVKDIADIVSTATGVPVGIGYITAAVSPHVIADSKTRIAG